MSTKTDAVTHSAVNHLVTTARDRMTFDPAPSWRRSSEVVVDTARSAPAGVCVVGVNVGVKGSVPKSVGLDRATLAAAGFEGKVGQTFVVPRRDAADVIAIGI